MKKYPSFDYTNCVSCGICAQVCPVSALGMEKEGKSGKYRNVFPELTDRACTGCGSCARACPMDVISMKEASDDPR